MECHGKWGALPATLAEIGFDQYLGVDFYDISLVDGYNIPVSMYPIAGTFHRKSNKHNDCTATSCTTDINRVCPHELAVHNSHGHVVACKSACTQFRTPEYCCSGVHNKRENCSPRLWKVNYPGRFKSWCPQAYSWAFDDATSTWGCTSRDNAHQSGYIVKFCP